MRGKGLRGEGTTCAGEGGVLGGEGGILGGSATTCTGEGGSGVGICMGAGRGNLGGLMV